MELGPIEQAEETRDYEEGVYEAEAHNEIVEEEITQHNQTPSRRLEKEFENNLMILIKMDPTTRPALPRLTATQPVC